MRKALLPQFALLASFKAQICHLLITAWHATIFFLGLIKVIANFRNEKNFFLPIVTFMGPGSYWNRPKPLSIGVKACA